MLVRVQLPVLQQALPVPLLVQRAPRLRLMESLQLYPRTSPLYRSRRSTAPQKRDAVGMITTHGAPQIAQRIAPLGSCKIFSGALQ
jgi:hypothetical protein